jgi:RNA polymerase sigma factor (sigma-70 family)
MDWLETGDSQAWEIAYEWLWPVAWTVAAKRLSNFSPDQAEDIAVKAINKAALLVADGKVKDLDHLRRLTAQVADKLAVDYIRRMTAQQRTISATESLEGKEHLPAQGPGPFEHVDAGDLALFLVDAAEKLPEQQRLLLKGFYLDGLTQAELAEKYGVPIGTVGVTLTRALETFRRELRNHPKLMQELWDRLR